MGATCSVTFAVMLTANTTTPVCEVAPVYIGWDTTATGTPHSSPEVSHHLAGPAPEACFGPARAGGKARRRVRRDARERGGGACVLPRGDAGWLVHRADDESAHGPRGRVRPRGLRLDGLIRLPGRGRRSAAGRRVSDVPGE